MLAFLIRTLLALRSLVEVRASREAEILIMIIFGEAHLRCVLKAYASYYNQVRTHLSLGRNAPKFRRVQSVGSVAALPLLGGLHHHYVRVSVVTTNRHCLGVLSSNVTTLLRPDKLTTTAEFELLDPWLGNDRFFSFA
jgi:hypothetical protein